MKRLRSALREPLVHFLALGGLLFVYFEWSGGGAGPGSARIVVTQGLVQHLASGFARTWQRPPTEAELKGLVDDHVKEEIATREAAAMGLDRDDTIIRRRLRQKLEFLVEETAAEAPVTDAEVQAWLDRHPEAFRSESQVALRQVYFSTDRRGASARADAERVLGRLRLAGSGEDAASLGDASMLPHALPRGPLAEVARSFGRDFAARIDALEPGRWTGPIESPYGLHLVLVEERIASSRPALAEVRPLVERELLVERRRAQLDALYERLLAKYTVTVDMPAAEKAAPAPAAGASAP
jgi:hypothetical protein